MFTQDTIHALLNADIDRLLSEKAAMQKELVLAADTFHDFKMVLAATEKDILAMAASLAEQHIRESLATFGRAS